MVSCKQTLVEEEMTMPNMTIPEMMMKTPFYPWTTRNSEEDAGDKSENTILGELPPIMKMSINSCSVLYFCK